MIVDIPAYDSAYFIKNGLVWGTFKGKIKQIYPNYISLNYLILRKLIVRKTFKVYTPDVFSTYIMPMVKLRAKTGKIYPDNAVYSKTLWQKVFSMAVSNSASTEATGLDGTYKSITPFAPQADAIQYVAQDNPIVDILVTTISLKEPDYNFVPVGGHIG